jgi:hypothetical protein
MTNSPYQAEKDKLEAEDFELLQVRRPSSCFTTRSPPWCYTGKQMAKVANIPFPMSWGGSNCAPSSCKDIS